MDSNQLLFYLRGVFENIEKPNKAVWDNIRAEVLAAKMVGTTVVPVAVKNPAATPQHFASQTCGYHPRVAESEVAPVLNMDKI